jgi:hypothetical protein
MSAPGCCCHEAHSLHLRYGPALALSTLDSSCYLNKPKTRFRVEGLSFLARMGIPPTGYGQLSWRTRTIAQVEENSAALHHGPLTAEQMREINGLLER